MRKDAQGRRVYKLFLQHRHLEGDRDRPYVCGARFAEAVCPDPESYFPYFRKRRQGKLLVCVSGVVECGSLSSLLSSLGARLAFGLWPAAAAATHRRPNQMADIKRGDGRERGGTGGGNDSFMAAEKEERDGEWQKKESE